MNLDIYMGWYILEGDTPVKANMETYFKWRDDRHNWVIQRTYLTKNGEIVAPTSDMLRVPRNAYVCISTVFLGTDHNFSMFDEGTTHTPILFETMLFICHGGEFLDPQWRHATITQAKSSHNRIVGFTSGCLQKGDDITSHDMEWLDD